MWRARRRGASLGFAGGARVQHRWGHSTSQNGAAAEREEISRRRFVTRNYGGLWRRILLASRAGIHRDPMKVICLDDSATIPEAESDLWLASAFPHLIPAMGTVHSRAMPSAFVGFCRTWRWVVASAVRSDSGWRIAGAWTWGRS